MKAIVPVFLSFAALATPLAAQDAATALADMQALVDTGTIGSGEYPAVAITAEGCMLTSTVNSISPQLGVPIVATSTADARELLPAAFAPDPSEGRLTIWIPREDQGPIDLTMTIETDDAAARTAFEGGLGADCSAAGPCSAVQAAPRMPVAIYEADADAAMDRARSFSTALSAFAAACAAQ